MHYRIAGTWCAFQAFLAVQSLGFGVWVLLAQSSQPFHACRNGTGSRTAPLKVDLASVLMQRLQDLPPVHCGCAERATYISLRRRLWGEQRLMRDDGQAWSSVEPDTKPRIQFALRLLKLAGSQCKTEAQASSCADIRFLRRVKSARAVRAEVVYFWTKSGRILWSVVRP